MNYSMGEMIVDKMNINELQEIKFAFEMTWQAIGMDILACTDGDTISKGEVIECVLDADRMSAYGDIDKAILDKFNALPYSERIKMAEGYFTFARYGY